jgi:glycosyltransferase involved in cell wall biosynthesis
MNDEPVHIFYSGFKHRRGGAFSHVESISRGLEGRGISYKVVTLDSLPIHLRYLPHICGKLINIFWNGLGYYFKDSVTRFLYRNKYKKIRYAIFEDVVGAWDTGGSDLVVCHALWSDNLQGKNINDRVLLQLKSLELQKIKQMHCPIITVSQPYSEYLSCEHFDEIIERDIGVVTLGINIADFDSEPTDTHRKKDTLVFCGSLEPRKNLIFLLDVFKKLCRLKDYHLIIIGDGPQKSLLEKYAADNALNVTFTGRLKRTEILDIYQTCAVYVHTSLKESYSMSLLEAKLCGLTTVAFAELQVPPEFIDSKVLSFNVDDWVHGIASAKRKFILDAVDYDEKLMCDRVLSYLEI